jgi:hypothetical protein
VVADLSGDGWPDLVLPVDNGTGRITVFVSDSAGGLHPSNTYDLGGQFISIAARDWNGDGSPDLVVRTGKQYSLDLLYNRGDGTFAPPIDCGLYLPLFTGDVWEDFNHDGWMDLAQTSDEGNRVGVALGMGGCDFAPFRYYEVPGKYTQALQAADMNGDGQLDLVTIGGLGHGLDPPSDHLLGVLLGKPDGTFMLASEPVSLGTFDSLGAGVTGLAIGEVTGDQRPDIVFTLNYGQTKTWKNTCQ